jgi:general L-amino acid transport system substrate-binding protein
VLARTHLIKIVPPESAHIFAKILLLAAIVLLAALWTAPPASAGDTLEQVKSRGTLRCGVSEGIVGFSAKNEAGRWVGLDADFCRAVAAAVLGSADKVTFVSLRASVRFPALKSGVIDLLVRNTAWTLSREAGLKVQFAGILFYEGQGFMVPAAHGVKSLAELNGATICVEKGTIHERLVTDHFAAHGMNLKLLVIDSSTGVADALFAGRCEAYTSAASQLAAARLRAPAGKTFDILPERISKEPLGPVVRSGDEEWLTLVRWILFSLIAAEEAGVTSSNVRAIRQSTKHPAMLRALGADREFSNALGTDPEWAMRAVESVGNYGEMFERNLGNQSPLHLERGLNRLWTHGGILYAPPLR